MGEPHYDLVVIDAPGDVRTTFDVERSLIAGGQ